MANQIYPDEGLLGMLEDVVANGIEYHLFENDVDINSETVLGDLVEPTTGDYEPITVEPEDWTVQSVDANIGTFMAAPITFTPNGADWSIRGYYAIVPGSGVIRYAANFDEAPFIVPDGESLIIVPILGDFSRRTD